jgi:hypothetical protein
MSYEDDCYSPSRDEISSRPHILKRTTEVFCRFQFEAIHAWFNCPFDDVDFLRVPHRHMFHVEAYKIVNHMDRDQEFIQLKRAMLAFVDQRWPVDPVKGYRDIGSTSCEMICDILLKQFDLSCVITDEDGENGSRLTAEEVCFQ